MLSICVSQTVINNCASAPCQNGGSCYNGINSYSCSCLAGYTNYKCQTGKCISLIAKGFT